MNDELRNDRDARLRAALRDGDPAAGDGLATEEVWALRRAVLNAAEETGRRAWLPAAALAAVAAVFAAAVALWMVQVRTEGPSPPRIAARAASPQPAVVPAPLAVSPEPVTAQEPLAEARPVRVARAQRRPTAPPLAPPPPVAEPSHVLPTQPVLADAAPEPRPLQIQFATPGGTRIIWMLAEESES